MRMLLVALCAVAAVARADEVVNSAPTPGEVGRYTVARVGDATVRLDTATGTSWFLCARKVKQGWCRAREMTLPAGPSGRYRLLEAGVLLDTVTGRAWQRCELPTPEKGLAWCAVED